MPFLLGPNVPDGVTSITAYNWFSGGSYTVVMGGYSTSTIFLEGNCSYPRCAFMVGWHRYWDIIFRWVFNDLYKPLQIYNYSRQSSCACDHVTTLFVNQAENRLVLGVHTQGYNSHDPAHARHWNFYQFQEPFSEANNIYTFLSMQYTYGLTIPLNHADGSGYSVFILRFTSNFGIVPYDSVSYVELERV